MIKFLMIILNIFFVMFTGKTLTGEPSLSERAQEQRAKWGIATDALDYPVNAAYLDSLRAAGATIHHTSRWFNGATVEMTDAQAAQVAQMPFVASVETTRDNSAPIYGPKRMRRQHATVSGERLAVSGNWTDEQLALYNLTPLHQAGHKGQGILMTVCDGGFTNANTMSCFRQSQELGHFDFTDDTDGFYGWTGVHGTECLSTISGITDGYYGAAPEADYYLMRSEEDATESPKEMDNLVAALEKADSLGVNVFSVSLGYAMFDNGDWDLNKETDLDGVTTRVSRAATIAARKGMLVVVAAGNEGNDPWGTISAPADADSILTVGAVDTNGTIGYFSSYGPSSDGRIKPEVCAVGVQTTLIYPNGTIVTSNGTSFATPLLAGLAASLWSALPDENAMQIRERIIRSADRYTHPDTNRYEYGYGIPDAWEAYKGEWLSVSGERMEHQAQKILRDGQILILRNGKTYTVSGMEIGD